MAKYATIVADPPWALCGDSARSDRPWASKGGRRGRETFFPYRTATLDWIKGLPVADIAESNAHLYLWVPASFNRRGCGVEVVEAWGFRVVSEMVWAKPNFGLGKFPRPQHEIVLVARRGNLPFARNNVGSVQIWRQARGANNGGKTHSAKPDAFADLVETASPPKYAELFARRPRLGWGVWGDEVEVSPELAGFA